MIKKMGKDARLIVKLPFALINLKRSDCFSFDLLNIGFLCAILFLHLAKRLYIFFVVTVKWSVSNIDYILQVKQNVPWCHIQTPRLCTPSWTRCGGRRDWTLMLPCGATTRNGHKWIWFLKRFRLLHPNDTRNKMQWLFMFMLCDSFNGTYGRTIVC